MSRTSFLRTSLACGVVGILALHAPVGFAQSTELSPERRAKAIAIYAELRRQDPQLEERSPERVAADLDASALARRAGMPDRSTVTARSAAGGVAASARCKEGYVVTGSHRADDPSVRIVAENRRDCDARGCRAYEVSAAGASGKPFNLTVSVTCAN